jgi:hypothetical protein
LGGTWAKVPAFPLGPEGRDMSLARPADSLPEL